MTNVRTGRIDDAVCDAGELITALTDAGPLTDKQICLLIRAAVRARVNNAQEWEIKQSVQRVVTDLGARMKIVNATCGSAPIVLLYGAEGRGKTTLAAKFLKPLGLLLERGLPAGVKLDAVDGLETYSLVIDAIRELYQDPRGYETLIIDTLDALEPMLLEHVCNTHHWKNIESPSFGKGFVIADQEWRRFIRAITALRDKHGMTVVLVTHSEISRIDDPRAPSFTQYAPKLHKRARALIQDAADIIGFLAEDLRVVTDDGGFRERVRATSSYQRFLFCEGNPAFIAKNRYSMPPKIAVPADFDIGELTKHWSHT